MVYRTSHRKPASFFMPRSKGEVSSSVLSSSGRVNLQRSERCQNLGFWYPTMILKPWFLKGLLMGTMTNGNAHLTFGDAPGYAQHPADTSGVLLPFGS